MCIHVSLSKGKTVPVLTMKAYKGSRVTATLIPNLGTGWRYIVNIILYLGERTLLSTEEVDGRASAGLAFFSSLLLL
jgi:hypothetical protein